MVSDFHVPGFYDLPPSITKFMPPIERSIFILHAMEEISTEEIAGRLAVSAAAVTAFIAEALAIRDAVLRGEEPRQRLSPIREQAEASLRARFRAYCEARRAVRGFRQKIYWRPDEDEERSVFRVIFASMKPRDLEAFLLWRVDRFTPAEIARHMGTFQWVTQRRMGRAIAMIDRGYCGFADWLLGLGRAQDIASGHPLPRHRREPAR